MKGTNGLPERTEGATLEGAIGNLAAIRFDRPADVDRFAADPNVLTIRLPQSATETITPLPDGSKPVAAGDLLKMSGVEALHRLGYTGKGVKVLLVASDFTGAEKVIGNGLPKSTRILDLTTELNPEIMPQPRDPNRIGNGTAAALALVLAAPDAELVLVRIDPDAGFQPFTILRGARGDEVFSEALRSRLEEVTRRTIDITSRKEAAIAEYREAFADLADDVASKTRRSRAKATLEALNIEQLDLVKRIDRLNTFRKKVLSTLAGARVLVNTLEWESGYPLDSMSLLSRALEQLATPLATRIRRRTGDPATADRPH